MHNAIPREELDSIFHEIRNRLTSQGNKILEKELLAILHRVMSGVEYLSRRYTDWWTTLLDIDTIDVGNPAAAPYNLVIARFQLKLTAAMCLSQGDSIQHGFIPSNMEDQDEKDAMNAFWNEIISTMKGSVLRPT